MFKEKIANSCVCQINSNSKYVLFTRYDFLKEAYVDFVNSYENLQHFVPASYCDSRTFKQRCIKMKYIPYRASFSSFDKLYDLVHHELFSNLASLKSTWNSGKFSHLPYYNLGIELFLFAEYVVDHMHYYSEKTFDEVYFDIHVENVRMNRTGKLFFTDPLSI